MHIDIHRQADGSYLSIDGVTYDTAEDYLQSEILGFCGCGNQLENLRFVRTVLTHIHNHRLINIPDFIEGIKRWKAEEKAIFHTEQIADFVYYTLCEKDLTEHGTSIPGWLTDKGTELLEDLIEMLPNESPK